jgi:C-terminal processing protease CtpA/Prc
LGQGVCHAASLTVAPVGSYDGQGLDAFLSGLETNGVLADRTAALVGGVRGVLRSIDPEVVISGQGTPLQDVGPVGSSGTAMQAVELWQENLAYLKVSGLNTGSGAEILAHLKSLSSRWGLLLDLRGGGGEDLESVATLAALVRNQGEALFVVTDNRGVVLGTNSVSGAFVEMPLMMILVDEGTKGAAEALASVFKRGGGVMLVGSMTGGDPYLRSWISLPGGRSAWLRTKKIIPASGKSYEQAGVSPDILVEAASGIGHDGLSRTNRHSRVLSEKSGADRDLMMRVEGDAALRRATDILLGLQALGGYGQE